MRDIDTGNKDYSVCPPVRHVPVF